MMIQSNKHTSVYRSSTRLWNTSTRW